MTTTGGEPRREPAITATTLRAGVGTYRFSATTRADAARAAPASTVSLASLDTWIAGCAIRISEPFGVEQPHTGPFAGADNHHSAVGSVPAQPFVFSSINRSRRQLGHEDGFVVAAPAESAGHTIGGGSGSVERRHRRDTFAVQLQVAGDRVQPIQFKHLGAHFNAQPRRLLREPNSARLVAGCRGPVSALRIPRGQPPNRPRSRFVKRE